jgi:hypothetical protein
MSAYTPPKFRVLREREIRGEVHAKAGTIVYGAKGYDYGLASDDSRATGLQHRSVTLKEDGDYPFFTIPERDLELIPA